MNTATVVVLAVVGYAVYYVIACWLWPFAACFGCRGDGKKRSPSGKSWRYCKRCKGTGARLRIGRNLWNWWHGVYAKGR